jgi:hypothetical protein
LAADERVFHVLLQSQVIKLLPLKVLDEDQQWSRISFVMSENMDIEVFKS